MKRSMTNWVIWRVVRYFFHYVVSARSPPVEAPRCAYPDLGTTGGSVVVVVHDNVDPEVKANDNPLLSRSAQLCRPLPRYLQPTSRPRAECSRGQR